jgi:divinyl protochlorophyllide a 8-vinyl-reductase
MQATRAATTESYAAHDAVIGPNALIQTVNALRDIDELPRIDAFLTTLGEDALLTDPPQSMIDEARFARMITALVQTYGIETARDVLQRSGEYTADYVLANRIPGLFQTLLKWLPARPALRLLLMAIRQHAWTFTGSGEFAYTMGDTPELTVRSHLQPLEASRAYYGGAFKRLFRVLVHPDTTIKYTFKTRNDFIFCSYVVQF